MADFKITTPDGVSYKVTADTPEQAYAAAQSMSQSSADKAKMNADFAKLGAMTTDPERSADVQQRVENLRQAGGGTTAASMTGMGSMIPFSDELASAVGAPRGLLPGHHGMAEEYNRQMEAEQQARENAQAEHPFAYGVGQAGALIGGLGRSEAGLAGLKAASEFNTGVKAGAIVPTAGSTAGSAMAPAASLAAMKQQAVNAARTAATPATAAATLAPDAGLAAKGWAGAKGIGAQMVEGAKTGGTYGALQGAGEGEGLQDRLEKGLQGAKGGALLGAAAPLAVSTGVMGFNLAKRGAGAIAEPLGNILLPESMATSHLQRVLAREGTTPEQFAQRFEAMQRVAPEAVPADVGGANVRGLARAVRNVPGEGRQAILEGLSQRAEETGDRVTSAVRNVLRNPNDFNAEGSRLVSTQEHQAGPLYEQAYATAKPVDLTRVLNHIDEKLGTMSPGHLAGPDDIRPDSINATLLRIRGALAGRSGAQRFNLRQLQSVKLDLDAMISDAKRAGDGGKVRALMDVKRNLLGAMDASSPVFKQARGVFAGAAEGQDALEAGRNIFKMTADDVNAATQGMSKGERELYQIGVARAIKDQIDNAPAGFGTNADVVKKIFGTPRVRDALKAGFGDDQAFRRFQAVMMREGKMRQTYSAVSGNSTTAAQLADVMDMNQAAQGDWLTHLLAGKVTQSAASAIRSAITGQRGLTENVANHVARLLLTKDPQHIRNAVTILRKRQVSADAIRRMLEALGQGTAAGVGLAQGTNGNRAQ
jgi:hypothetical protein